MSELVRVREGGNWKKRNIPAIDAGGFLFDSEISIDDLRKNTPEVLETKVIKGGIVFQDFDNPLTLLIDSTQREGNQWLIAGELNEAPRTYLTLPDNDETLNRRSIVVLTTGNQVVLLSSELAENPLRPNLSPAQILIAEILQTPEGLKLGDISDLHKQDTDRALGKGTPEEITIEQLNELLDREPYTDENAVGAVADALQDSPSISLVMGEDGLRAFVVDSKYVPGGPAQFPDVATRDAFYTENPHLRIPGIDVTIVNAGVVPIAASVSVQAVKSVVYNNDIWLVGKNGDVVRWDVVNKKVLHRISLGKSSIHALVFGARLFVAHPADNQVSVINLTTRTLSTTLAVENTPCYFLEYSGLIYVLPEKELTMKVIHGISLAITTYAYDGGDFYGLGDSYSSSFQTMLRVGNTLYFPSISTDIYYPQSSMYWFDTVSKEWGCLFDTGQIAITHQAVSANQRYIFLSAFTFNNDQGGLNVFDTQTKSMVFDEEGIYVYLRGFKHRMYVRGSHLFVSESTNNVYYQIRMYDASAFSFATIKTFTTGSAIASFNEVNEKLYCTATSYLCYVIDLTTLEMTEFRLSRPLRSMQATFGGFRVYDTWTMDNQFNLYSNGSQGAMIIDTVIGRNGVREKYFSDVENQRWVQTYPTIQFLNASETQKGLVQLTAALNNPSNALALTAGAGKSLQDQVSASKAIIVDFVVTTNVDMNDEFPLEVDGVALTNGQRVLFAGQTNQVEIGVYFYFEPDPYYYARTFDFYTGKSVSRGQEFLVLQGGVSNGGASFKVTNGGTAAIIVGTHAIELTRVGSAGESSGSSLALGEAADTAFRGDQGKQAYDHSQETGNAHNLTKADLNLDQVANLAPANYPVSIAQAAADQAVKNELLGDVAVEGNTLAKLYAFYQTLSSIVGGVTPDGNSFVDQAAELLAVFSTYPEGVDIVTALRAKVNTADIVNNLTEIVAGKPLDATQGKILKDLIEGKAKDSLVTREVGAVVDHTFNASSAPAFTKTGTDTTAVFGAGGLALSGVGSNNTLNHLTYDGWLTGAEIFIQETYFVPTADGNGLGAGLVYADKGLGMFAQIILGGATKGQLRLEKINNATGATTNKANSGTTYFPVTNGQAHKLSFIRYRASYVVMITNTVTAAFQLLNYNGVFSSAAVSNNDPFRAAKPVIFHYGGDQTITRFAYHIGVKTNQDLLIVSDSLGAGIFSGTNEQSWGAKLMNSTCMSIDKIGLPGARVQDAVDILPEILAMRPKAVLLELGYNDSVPATFQNNLQIVLNACQVNGIKVFLLTIFPKISVAASDSDNTYLKSTAVTSKATVIDMDSVLLDGTGLIAKYVASDNIHINSIGQDVIYRKIVSDPSFSSYILLSNKLDARLLVNGMDFFIQNSVWISSAYYAMGTASQSTTVLTASGTNTTWTSEMVGSYVVFADGKADLITGFTDSRHLVMATSRTIAGQSYAICKPGFSVNQSGNVGLGTLSPTEQLHIDGHVQLSGGNKLKVKAGSSMHFATLVAGTVTVNTTAVAANSVILVQRQTDGGTVAASYSVSKVVGTSITITAKDGVGVNQTADTSTVVWRIIDVN